MEPTVKQPLMNRTGIEGAPILAEAMQSGVEHLVQDPSRGNEARATLERSYIHPQARVGSMPPPATLSGELKTMTDDIVGKNSQVMLNKLGERLAYERSGVRAYEAFIRKCMVLADGTNLAAPLDELWDIRNEEEAHFLLLAECVRMLGGDPTAQTPDADVSGVASLGIFKVLADPRTSLSQCLEMLLMIELTDNASWELLIKLADEMGATEMAERFRRALMQENSHLERVRAWYEQAVMGEASKTAMV